MKKHWPGDRDKLPYLLVGTLDEDEEKTVVRLQLPRPSPYLKQKPREAQGTSERERRKGKTGWDGMILRLG